MKVLVAATVCLMMSPAFAAGSQGAQERIVVAQAGKSAPRTYEDVARVIDSNKGSFYALYARALRKNPNVEGDVVFSFSIAPDGTVTQCALASSTLKDPEMEKGLVERLAKIKFGAKGNTVYTSPGYPMSFFSAGKATVRR